MPNQWTGPEPLADRFWRQVDTTGECWVWTGSTRNGYGQINIDGRPRLAHRVAWTLKVGPIPEGANVLHECDNRPCVRPSHLWLGSYADNNRDMAAKGRHVGNRKLTIADVRMIRSMASERIHQKQIAATFGIGQQAVSLIVTGKRWREAR